MVSNQYRLSISILIFMTLFSLFHLWKPGFAYNEKGGFRPFGVGYQNKTIFPVWIVAILLAVFSYTIVLFM
jgi:hypothetical protein